MGTSNWQQIPFCVEALMKIAPSSVLDVGVGFGRWGILTREFCDVWSARVLKEDWAVQIEGIEGFPRSITTYHDDFYDKIHIGDAAQLVPQLLGPWSVTIYGDVLEHFDRQVAESLLECSLTNSDYVLVNLPIGEEFEQGEVYGNPYERHLSAWNPSDLAPFSMIRHAMFRDFRGRPYGSFILSRRDPKDLRSGLFSLSTRVPDAPIKSRNPNERLLKRIREISFELEYIKRSSTFQLATSIRKHPISRLAKRIFAKKSHELVIEALAQSGAQGKGSEVWIMGIHNAPGETAIPYGFLHFEGDWNRHEAPDRPYGAAFSTVNGKISAATGPHPIVTLMKHPWSGKVRLSFGGESVTLDLSCPGSGEIEVGIGRDGFVTRETMQEEPSESTPVRAMIEKVSAPSGFSESERQYIELIRSQRAGVIAVHCPRWLGVSSSTRSLFTHCYQVPPDASREPGSLTEDEILHHARVLAETQVPSVVFSGGDEAHFQVAMQLKRLRHETRVDLFWHGGYFHVSEDYDWKILKLWMNAVRDGSVASIATCKAGKEDFFRSLGIPSALVLNYVPGELLDCPDIPDHPARAGLWLSGSTVRKPPFAMLAAAKMVDHVELRGAGLSSRGIEFVHEIGLRHGPMNQGPIPAAELFKQIRQTHVTMYITLTECCPMLPLESMQLGVPCLIGPTSHLFEDNPFLFERLVVPFPERADVIAASLRRVLDERRDIIAEYRRYIPDYNRRAAASVASWFAMTDSQLRTRTPRS